MPAYTVVIGAALLPGTILFSANAFHLVMLTLFQGDGGGEVA